MCSGMESTNGYGIKYDMVEHPVFEKKIVDKEPHIRINMFDTRKTIITETYHQNVEILDDETLSASGILFQNSQEKVSTISKDDNIDAVQKAIVDLVKEKLYGIQETVTCEIDHQTDQVLDDVTVTASGISFQNSHSKDNNTDTVQDEIVDSAKENLHAIQDTVTCEIDHEMDETFSSPDQSFPTSCEIVIPTFRDFNHKTREDAVVELTEESNGEITDIDVERVIEKQETHDLFCPNCHSCITRKVILVRKKRKVRSLRPKPKPSIIETRLVSELDPVPAYVADEQSRNTEPLIGDSTPEANNDNIDDRDRAVFRCLSCFTLFIPNGHSFKLFGNFRNRNGDDGSQNTQDIPTAKTNRFLSIFSSNKGKPTIEQGNADQNEHTTTQAEYMPPQHDHFTASRVAPTLVATTVLAEDSYQKPPPSGINVLVPSTLESSILEQAKIEMNGKYNVPKSPVLNDGSSSVQEVPSLAQSSPRETSLDGLLSTQGSTIIEGLKTDLRGKLMDVVVKNRAGDDVVLTIKTEVGEPSASQKAPNIMVPEEAGVLPQTRPQVQTVAQTDSQEATEGRGLDILKSIVYGGLVESITSLGVVSSAVGAGASTLNILVLAVANLIGGLFVIGHHLLELRDIGSVEASIQTNRYKEQLGRRENFILHATVVILSFLIFGLVAPVTYAFSFRGSDNTEYKLLVAAAASLFCITLLAIGKGHVRTPQSYIKTMFYYVVMGLMASGMSYVVGVMLNQLLVKLGLFESSSAVSMPLFKITGPKKELAWTSY